MEAIASKKGTNEIKLFKSRRSSTLLEYHKMHCVANELKKLGESCKYKNTLVGVIGNMGIYCL